MDQGILERDGAATANGKPAAGRLDLRVSGMSCAACVRRVERARFWRARR